MGRSSSYSSSSPYDEKKYKRLRSEDRHRRPYRTRSEEDRDYREKRRQAWRMQQKLERDHERLKKQKILEYELKREQSKREHARRSSRRSQSRSQNHNSRDRRQSLKSTAMSQKLELSDGSIPLFKGGSEMKIDPTELRRIKVDIHRNIPGATLTNRQLQREIVNPEEVTLKRREDEGMKPIFHREELELLVKSVDSEKSRNKARLLNTHFSLRNSFAKTSKEDPLSLYIRLPGSNRHEGMKPIFDRDEIKRPECSTSTEEVEEHRTVKTIDTERTEKQIQSSKRRSRSLSSSRRCDKGAKEASSYLLRHERSSHHLDKKSNRRSYSDDRHKDGRQSSSRENGRRDRLHDHTGHSSSHRLDRKEYSSKRRSSRERSCSEERKRCHSGYDHLSRNGQSYREYRGRSRERRERQRSVEEKNRERSRERRISTLPHYIESVPVPLPVYYGNFPPRPVMMGGPMMPSRGPLMRNRLPIGPRLPFPPRFMHPDMYRPSLPSNPRFNRMF